ncbi:uncharacterized protein LOC100893315 [Strongylocentrotus purpuratus]|uniref:Death domain-containing protein n=1 Tax=Strongylocentrotus purpuratus TaxID=7668 RepID=A0A7M7GG18_STRPU|nr:uncharacterized protein LOC100893315 [Strongylocentrotus purpuratus]
MSQANPAPSQPDPLPSTSVNPKGKASTLEMVTQDKQFQSLRSRDGKVDCQNQGEANVVVGEEMSTKGTLLSQDVRADGWCPEGNSVVSVGDGLEHPGDEASRVSISGSLRSGNFDRNPRNIADCKHGDIQDLEEVQENLRDTHIRENRSREPAAGEPVIRKEDDQQDCQTKEGHCKRVNVGVSERSGQSPTAAGEQKPAVAVPPNENIRIGDGGGEKGGGKGGGGGDSKKEPEASMFPMQSSDDGQQIFSQENSNKQSSDNARSLHSSQSDPSMATPRDSPPSSLKVSRSQSLQNSRKNEHYDLLLIYTKEDESTCANKFREYAASKDWIVTSLAELPIGTLSLKNFRKAMECCSYVVLLISSHFTSDKTCERHYNTAIQYGDTHTEFADCVLPIIFDSAELPPELDAIQHVEWGGQFFDNVMTRSVDVQKRLDRELREAAAARSSTPSRAMSVDAGIPTTSSYQMASTPPTLSTVPARMPMHETESYQTGAAAQQPPVQRVPEQEACLMPSDNQSPVLPPIPVAGTSDVGVTQISLPGAAATTAGKQVQHAATRGTHLITAPGAGYHTPHMVDHSGMPPHQSLAPTTSQPHAAYRQQVSLPAMQYQPSQHPEGVAGMSQLSGSAIAQHGSHIVPAQSLTNPLPATLQPHSIYQQQSSVAAMQYQPLQYPDAGGYGLQHPISMAAPSGFPQFQRTISHPAQDYENLSCEQILQSLSPELNPGQAASQMLSVTRFIKICELLDPFDVRGNDWRFLAEILDLSTSHIRYLEENRTGVTRKLLEVFFLKNGTKGKIEVLEKLLTILKTMERHDAAEHVDREIKIAKCKGR